MCVCFAVLGTRRVGWTASSTCSPSSTSITANRPDQTSGRGTSDTPAEPSLYFTLFCITKSVRVKVLNGVGKIEVRL